MVECSELRAFVDGREICHFKAFTQTFKQTNIQLYGQRKLEYWLDEYLKFTGKTSDQLKCSRSALAEAYVDKRAAGKKGSTNKYRYRSTSAGEKSNAPWNGLVDFWRCGRFRCLHLCSLASCSPSTYSGFEIWVLRFRDLGVPFSSFGCFVLRSSFSSASFSKLPR